MTRWTHPDRALLVFVLLFGLFRTAVADWNPIPSDAMHPTVLEGSGSMADLQRLLAQAVLFQINLFALQP